jgi:hypothetical protein
MDITESGALCHPTLVGGEKTGAYPSKSAKGIGVCGDARGFPGGSGDASGRISLGDAPNLCPAFNEMLARVEGGETGGVVVAKLDRFARSLVDTLEALKRLDAAGATSFPWRIPSTRPSRRAGSSSTSCCRSLSSS